MLIDKKRKLALVLLLLTLMQIACGTSVENTIDPEIAIIGNWSMGPTQTLQFKSDGTFARDFTRNVENDPKTFGTYTFDGKTLILTEGDGSLCRQGLKYIWAVESYDANSITAYVALDECFESYSNNDSFTLNRCTLETLEEGTRICR